MKIELDCSTPLVLINSCSRSDFSLFNAAYNPHREEILLQYENKTNSNFEVNSIL